MLYPNFAKMNKGKCLTDKRGAVTVEFAITLLFLFLFFIAFVQIFEIFIAHERLSFASFVVSRTYSVNAGDRKPAERVKRAMEPRAVIRWERPVTLDKEIDLPIDFENIFAKGGAKFTVSNFVKAFIENEKSGDNW